MGEAYAHDKRLIRDRLEARRRRLTRADVARLSASACARLLELPVLSTARHVVAYAALENELDPAVVAQRSRVRGTAVYHPRPGAGTPAFVCDGDGRELPVASEGVVFLVPGVAFDVRGVRLGRGRGWYDRALACHPGAIRVGLAYDFQVLPELPEAPWDVRMHLVVTDARLIGELPAPGHAQKEERT